MIKRILLNGLLLSSVALACSAILNPLHAVAMNTLPDGGGGGGGVYYDTLPAVVIPELTPVEGADIDVTEAPPGSTPSISYQYTVQLNKTLWYGANRFASGCPSGTGCIPSSDSSLYAYAAALSNPNITIAYDVGVYDAVTGARYAPNATVPVGTSIKLVFGAFVPSNIFWFGTGYASDSPYGEWRANATAPTRVASRVTCDAKDYTVNYSLSGGSASYDIYIPLVVNPPTRSISVIPSNLSCGALSNNADGTATMTCTVDSAGPVVPRFNFGTTYGKFYYRYYDHRSGSFTGCFGNNIPLTDSFGIATAPSWRSTSSLSSAYQLSIPAKDIDYPLAAVQTNSPPATPTLTCDATGETGQQLSFDVSAADPEGDSLRYGFDWVNAGSINAWVPTSGYVPSGTAENVKHSWSAPGTYTVKVLAEDTNGGQSAWAPCTVTITAPPPQVSCVATPNPATTADTVTMTPIITNGSGNYTYAWTDSSGFSSTSAAPTKKYGSIGTYTINLALTDLGPAPIATLTPTPATIANGSSATLAWSSTDATSCSGTNFSTGGAVSGSKSVSPSSTTTYGLSCTGDGGTDTDSKTITVTPAPTPTAALTATPSSAAAGSAVTLAWSSANTSSCTGTNFSTLGATTGTVTVNPLSTTAYSVSCSGTGGTATDNKTLIIVPAPTVTFIADPASIISGGSSDLVWSSTNATYCVGTSFVTGNATSGTVTVSPSATKSYGVTCYGAGGSAVKGATVTVGTGGGGGGGCFAEDTLITMADGSTKRIDNIAVGDTVLGEDENGNRKPQTVSHLFAHTGAYDVLKVNGMLIVTPNHPLWVIRGGAGSWITAGELRIGDLLSGTEALVSVTAIEHAGALPTVHNLETMPDHTYFAGGVLVHNKLQSQSVQN